MSAQVILGDSIKTMRKLHRQKVQVDMIFVDPPYHLTSIVERFGGANAKAAKSTGATGRYARESKGFMGKEWDGGDIAFRVSTWKAAFKLLKPGGHIIAFAHTKNYHRLATAIEKAGFEVRDMLDWVYGQGTPKSKNLTGEFDGFGSALKPAKEPAVLARKPLIGSLRENMLEHGVGALNIDALRVPYAAGDELEEGDNEKGRWPANLTHDGSAEVQSHFPAKAGQKSAVLGTEPSALTANIFNPFSGGRPASAPLDRRGNAARFFRDVDYSNIDDWCARIVYCPKAPNSQRVYRCDHCDHRQNETFETCPSCRRRMKKEDVKNHPTVKPIDMLAYWIRGVCPEGGTILDPFAGTGSTGIAALREGRHAILIDNDPDSIADIEWRIAHMSGGDLPLFGGG